MAVPSVRTAGVAVLAAMLGGAAPATAELFRCEGPDGRTVFTDQKELCPGAESYEPDARIHSAPSSPRTVPPASRTRDALEAEAEEARARQWRQKRIEAEQAIEAIRKRREELRPYVSHCNRGGYVTTRDDAGIKQRLPCSTLKRDFAALDEEEARARDYLENGLPEECRKAGCLPGWIRK